MRETIYGMTGKAIFHVVMLVDAVQSLLGVQPGKRQLTAWEQGILQRVFGDSLDYGRIRVLDGHAGLFSALNKKKRPFAIGFNIYMVKPSTASTLVHECVHVWQYQQGGTRYIGDSALSQLHARFINRRHDPYDWVAPLQACGGDWLALQGAEAQAQFIQDVYDLGKFSWHGTAKAAETGQGAFFREATAAGCNEFRCRNKDFTLAANRAWKIISRHSR